MTIRAIQQLPPQVANQIAAGEAIERPASIVKELVENAIDAGASAITIEVAGATEYIRVTDNGCGIVPAQAALAFRRHTTSKIATADDLQHVHTLGFRGEALCSIAAIAQVELTTRPEADEAGAYIWMEGGELKAEKPAGCPAGTSIVVKNVFFNTPARLKFLKSSSTELGLIEDCIARIILSMPDIAIRYLQNNRTVFQSPGDGSLRSAIYSVYGREFSNSMHELAFDDHDLSVRGYISLPELTRANRTFQTWIVNRRAVRSPQLSFTLERAYATRLMTGRHPACVIFIALEGSEVDVNVHPQKLEIRFKDEKRVQRTLTAAVEAIFANEPVRSAGVTAQKHAIGQPVGRHAGFKSSASFHRSAHAAENQSSTQDDRGASFDLRSPELTAHFLVCEPPETSLDGVQEYILTQQQQQQEEASPPEHQEQIFLEESQFQVIGQAFGCYWFVQQEEDLYLLDQHAAHERLLYDAFSKQIEIASQQLLAPQTLRLSGTEYALLLDNLSVLESIGFLLEPFGSNTVLLRAVPYLLAETQSHAFIYEVLEQMDASFRVLPAELKRERIMRSACKQAVKAGDLLTPAEINTLLTQFIKGTALTCPHGRPIVVRMRKQDLEKMFRRIV